MSVRAAALRIGAWAAVGVLAAAGGHSATLWLLGVFAAYVLLVPIWRER